MQRFITGIAGLCLATAGLTGLAPSAHADTTTAYSLETTDGTLHTSVGGGCKNFGFTYTATDADIIDWDIDAVNPSGYVADSAYEGQASGTDSFFLCSGIDPLGTYQVTGTLTQCYAPTYNCYDTQVHDSFVVSEDVPPPSPPTPTPVVYTQAEATLSASTQHPRFNQRVTLTVKARKQTATGYVPDVAASVFLQVKAEGRWVTVKHTSGSTDASGKFKIKYSHWNIRRPVTLRAVLAPGGTYMGVTSSPVRVTTRS